MYEYDDLTLKNCPIRLRCSKSMNYIYKEDSLLMLQLRYIGNIYT